MIHAAKGSVEALVIQARANTGFTILTREIGLFSRRKLREIATWRTTRRVEREH